MANRELELDGVPTGGSEVGEPGRQGPVADSDVDDGDEAPPRIRRRKRRPPARQRTADGDVVPVPRRHPQEPTIDRMDDEPVWLVIQTRPNQERTAVLHLAQRDVEPYCPMFLEPPWHRRAPRGPVPLFTSYVFVYCIPKEHLARVVFCPGVLRPVSFVQRLATVEPELIAFLRERSGDRGYIVHEEIAGRIPEEAKVKVLDGPLRGMEGVLRGYLRGGQRARVLLRLLCGNRLIEVDANCLRYLNA